jgi:hypothetical protein
MEYGSGRKANSGTKKHRTLTISFPEAAVELLSAAAKRRNQSVETLTANVVCGVLMRGSIDKPPDLGRSLRLAARYEVESDDDEIALSEVG